MQRGSRFGTIKSLATKMQQSLGIFHLNLFAFWKKIDFLVLFLFFSLFFLPFSSFFGLILIFLRFFSFLHVRVFFLFVSFLAIFSFCYVIFILVVF